VFGSAVNFILLITFLRENTPEGFLGPVLNAHIEESVSFLDWLWIWYTLSYRLHLVRRCTVVSFANVKDR
jgi:hypothetical protein